MRRIMLIFVLILNGIILFYACKKEQTVDIPEPTEYDTQTSQDNALAEGTFNDVNNIAFQAVENDSLSTYKVKNQLNSLLSTCATVTVTPNGNGGTIEVNFGTTNCLCKDYRYRRGIINITYTGAYRDSATVISTSFDNYFVGRDTTKMFQVTGTKVIANMGTNSSGNMNFSITVNGQLTNSSGISMNWSSSRNREWLSGSATLGNWADDEYVVTGSATGTNFEGNTFAVNITHGLHVTFSCAYITEGTFDLTPSGKPTRTFDFGTGTCDAIASVSVNGTTFPITLR